jgi:hypothetical protein
MSCLNMQAPQMVLQYKGLHGRFCTHVLCFVLILVLPGVVGKRKLFLLCIRLFCAVPLFTALPSWYLSRFLEYVW